MGGFYSNLFLFLFLLLLLLFFVRLLYARHMLRVRASLAARSASNTPQMAAYFIQLRAAQDARATQAHQVTGIHL